MPVTFPVPRTYADEHRKATLLLGYNGSLQDIPLDVLQEGVEASCRLAKEGSRFSATASNTDTADAAFCEEGNPETLGASNYEGQATVFRFFNPDNPGVHDDEGDEVFQAIKHKGTTVTWVFRSTGKRWDDDWEAGDEYSAYRGAADNWQEQDNLSQGYIKAVVPFAELRAELNGEVAAGDSGGGDTGGD